MRRELPDERPLDRPDDEARLRDDEDRLAELRDADERLAADRLEDDDRLADDRLDEDRLLVDGRLELDRLLEPTELRELEPTELERLDRLEELDAAGRLLLELRDFFEFIRLCSETPDLAPEFRPVRDELDRLELERLDRGGAAGVDLIELGGMLFDGRTIDGRGVAMILRLERDVGDELDRPGLVMPARDEVPRDGVAELLGRGRMLRLELRLLFELLERGLVGTATPDRAPGSRLLEFDRVEPDRPTLDGVVVVRPDRDDGRAGCDGATRGVVVRRDVDRLVDDGVDRGTGCGIPTRAEPPGICLDVLEPDELALEDEDVDRLLPDREGIVGVVRVELRVPDGEPGVARRVPLPGACPRTIGEVTRLEERPAVLRGLEGVLRPGIDDRVREPASVRSLSSGRGDAGRSAPARPVELRELPLPLLASTLLSRS